ncbi:XkdQ/YqbQ family protein [Clostridium senegalense]
MQIQLLIDDKKGNIFDISELVKEVIWKTKRKDGPSSLDIEFIEDSLFKISNGDVVKFKVDNNNIFYGYIFKSKGNSSPEIKITAYDQIKYLMYNDVYVGVNKKASDIAKEIFKNLNLKVGTIEDTGYIIPTIQEDDKKYLDVIYSALDKTVSANTKTFVLYDEFGTLNLKDINNMKQKLVISDDSNLGDYDWENSIEESYNRIKFVKDNEKKGGRDVYIAQDSNNIAKWGRLQLFKKVDDKLNKAQIEEMVNGNLKLKNKETKKLSLKDVIGTDTTLDLKLRGGSGVYVDIKKRDIKQYYLIEEATHKFSKDGHIMDFDLKVV